MRQVTHLQKRLEHYEVSSNNSTSTPSRHEAPRTSRVSLEEPTKTVGSFRGGVPNLGSNSVDMHPGSPDSASSEGTITNWDSLDKSVLVKKILRLQSSIAKQNEKIEFLQEHNQTLLDELVHS